MHEKTWIDQPDLVKDGKIVCNGFQSNVGAWEVRRIGGKFTVTVGNLIFSQTIWCPDVDVMFETLNRALNGRRGEPIPKGELGLLDERFVDVMERVARDRGSQARQSGTTELHTPVLRFGRVQVDQPLKVRILAGGRTYEVGFAGSDAARRALADAALEGHWCRLRVRADWVLVADAQQLDPTSIVVIEATRWTPLSGAASLTAIGTLSSETSALLLEQLDEGD